MADGVIRGKPVGDTPAERLAKWLARPAKVGEDMIWVGKDYSLAQCKRDVCAVFGVAPPPPETPPSQGKE
jgi:hypothetical protein